MSIGSRHGRGYPSNTLLEYAWAAEVVKMYSKGLDGAPCANPTLSRALSSKFPRP